MSCKLSQNSWQFFVILMNQPHLKIETLFTFKPKNNIIVKSKTEKQI